MFCFITIARQCAFEITRQGLFLFLTYLKSSKYIVLLTFQVAVYFYKFLKITCVRSMLFGVHSKYTATCLGKKGQL